MASAIGQPASSGPKPELVRQLGHSGSVTSISFSPDGRILVSAGFDKSLKMWDVASGRELRTLTGHTGRVKAVAFSPDGRAVLSGSDDNTLKLWDPADGRVLRTFTGHRDSVNAAMFSPDGRMILSGSSDKTLKLWDVDSGREVRTLIGHGDEVTSVGFSKDGSTAASASDDRTLKIWDTRDGRALHTLTGHQGQVKSVAFSLDGRTIVSGAWDRQLKLWDTGSGRELKTLPGHDGYVAATAFAPDGRIVVSASRSVGGRETELIKVWDVATGRELRALKGHSEDVNALTFSPDGHMIASASSDNTIKLWNAADARALRTLTGVGHQIAAVAYSPDGQTILSASAGELNVWDAASGRQLRKLDNGGALAALAYAPDGKTFATGTGIFLPEGVNFMFSRRQGSLKLWDTRTEQPLWSEAVDDVSALAFSRDGRSIVTANWKEALSIHETATGQALRKFKGHGRPVSAVAFAPDGRSVVSGGADNLLRMWETATGRELRTFRGHTASVRAVAFAPDGRALASASGDTTIRIWSAGGQAVHTLTGHSDAVTAVRFAPDGRILVSASADATIKMWDIAGGRHLRTLAGHIGSVLAIAIAPDANTLASGGADKTLRRWSGSGDLLTTSIVGAAGEWVTITPEGFFDASDGGRGGAMLNLVSGLEVFSIDQLFDQLYRPDLVREKLAGDPLGLVRDAAAKLDLTKAVASGAAPRVALAVGTGNAAGEQAEFRAEITAQGGGIGRVEWRVNGVTLGVEARGFDRLGGNQAVQPTPQASVVATRTLALAPGENAVEVVAYNAANLIASNPARITITGLRPAAQAARPRLHVLAVGVNEYWDSRLRLNFATADAKALADALRRAGEGLYDGVEISTVLDADVTLENLDTSFSRLAAKVRPDDVFVFFLAGHGKTVDGRYYFLPQDFRYTGEESIAKRGIGQERWQQWFARISARKSLLLYDTCESGSLTGERVATRGIERIAALERMTRATGRTTLTASTDDTPALEGYRGHGVFTYVLLDALGKADGNGDGLVDVAELASFIDAQVPQVSFQAFRQRQVPQMKIIGSNFSVVNQAAVLPKNSTGAVPLKGLTKPTHVVVKPVTVRQAADAESAAVVQLGPGMQVTLGETALGWTLLARDGQPLGYVDAGHLDGGGFLRLQ
jgi:WD40 repeat protein/uncharacterized caspase-like protein